MARVVPLAPEGESEEGRQGGKRAQRERTRRELRRCALARFAREGFDATKVADLCADAGVTERTFFRHFPSKESVLFDDHASRLGWFRDALGRRPPGEPLLESVRIAIESYPDDDEVVRQVALARVGLLSGRVIESQLRRIQGGFAVAIARHAESRLPRSKGRALAAAVVGEAVAGALVSALRLWGEHGARGTDDLRRRTGEALAVLEDLASLLRGAAGRRRARRGPSTQRMG
jgi:AcrR family transcriptional regulator